MHQQFICHETEAVYESGAIFALPLSQYKLNLISFYMNKKIKQKHNASEEDKKFPLPVYKEEDDIYNKGKEETFADEDQPEKRESRDSDKNLGEDLDVPGAELDDADEAIGEEDEENNYYSLGGDNHDDLEEDKG
jgi:hypothetical protein